VGQKRLALESLLRGPDQVLLLDEPDNYLDVPGKRWLEAELRATQKTVLLVSHDRELLAEAGTQIAAVELGGAGNTVWVHGGGFAVRCGDGGLAGSGAVAGGRDTDAASAAVLHPQTWPSMGGAAGAGAWRSRCRCESEVKALA